MIAVLLVGSGVAAFVLVLRRRFLLATVKGFSMAPALRPGDRLLVRRASLSRLHRRGRAGRADGRPATAYRLRDQAVGRGARDPVPEHVPSPSSAYIPPGWMAILRDNPDSSRDSRDYGLVTQKQLVGVVVRAIGT
ncbi:S26 family signal peptidase [Nonomuraea wenchangensis]|uniref:S26 family signal peptidase n=1 Tax=Nonomuraea wenchangensis TaxID=568860 RepID=UPI0033248DCA